MYKGLQWRLGRIAAANLIRCSTCLIVASLGAPSFPGSCGRVAYQQGL